SKTIAEYYLEELQNYLSTTRMSKSRLMREFLERRVDILMQEIDSLSIALRDFQVTNKAIALDQQTISLITLYSESIASYYQTDIEYELAKTQYGESSPVLEQLRERRSILADRIKSFESSGNEILPEYMIQIDRVPDLGMQYAQLKLSGEIQKKVFEYIYPQYELAKLEEMKDMPSFEIIDKPVLAGLRSKPKRAIIVVSVTIAAFLLACVIALFQELVLVANRDKVRMIMDALRFGSNKTSN
ncbi:MAG: hypothetical protein U1C33_05665, partial [Candidatus Cloacimonadaceae bacterium]|nr:hypothetical protein [Candidatus Cloacimonadaceae bacterium]